MYLKNKLLVMCLSIVCFSCAANTAFDTSSSNANSVQHAEQSWQVVTVKHIKLEGGFYGLLTSNGIKLLPTNLATRYQIDGTTLKVKGAEVKGMMSIQQWGMMFEITDIELIAIGSKKAQQSL